MPELIERGITATAMLAVLFGCAPKKEQEPPLTFKERIARKNEELEHVLEQAMEKQRIAPEERPLVTRPPEAHVLKPGDEVWIEGGKSQVLELPGRVDRVSIADPDLAGIIVLGPRSFMLNAKALPERRRQPSAGGMTLGGSSTGIVLGQTLTPEPRYAQTTLTVWTQGRVDSHTVVIADFVAEQVMLEVTVAELDRTAMEQYGFDFRILQNDLIAAGFQGGGAPPIFSTIPTQTNQPLLPLTISGNQPTYALIFPNEDVSFFITALENEGLATVLARPHLLAMSGQNALFQVGGEIPIRIATGFATDVDFKPFGTIVNFLPRVLDDGHIMLTVTPEVSEPDFSQTVEGIPTFRTRRASTSARLTNGQTLVIGGLLQTRRQEEISGVPYFKDIPFLGALFRQTRYTSDTTELLVVVQPTLVRPIEVGETVRLPTDRGPFTKGEVRTKPNPAKTTRPRIPGLP
jgi:pilus assembly protein CpaC